MSGSQYTAAVQQRHAIPIPERPKAEWYKIFNAAGFGIAFNAACLLLHSVQLVCITPLLFIPLARPQKWASAAIRYSKGCFAKALILMCQWFAPTELSITFEQVGSGKITQDQIESWLVKDKKGNVVQINLPDKTITIANHQVYADWWYLWCLGYFAGFSEDVYIVLKKSLKWIPVAGWAMQYFDFIFLARNWDQDKVQLAKQLTALGKQAEDYNNPLCLMLFPEGTLVSKLTRPISKKYAEKTGVNDLDNILLPRSTGLLYSLRSLAPHVPGLSLIDYTIIYPGIPARGYGQSYYTLRSIFFDRIPPPQIHMHIRVWNVLQDVPIGVINTSSHGTTEKTPEVEAPEQERQAFDVWLRELWTEKDQSITAFHEQGAFTGAAKTAPIRIPLQLKSRLEVLECFGFFLPALLWYSWSKSRGI